MTQPEDGHHRRPPEASRRPGPDLPPASRRRVNHPPRDNPQGGAPPGPPPAYAPPGPTGMGHAVRSAAFDELAGDRLARLGLRAVRVLPDHRGDRRDRHRSHRRGARYETAGSKETGSRSPGLILGYIGVALTALAIAGLLVFLFVFADDLAQNEVNDDAEQFEAPRS